jgi:hypothetical protein
MSKTVKRKLTKISFDFDKAHLALTDVSAGGACSLMNNPILLKSLEEGKTLSLKQRSLLESVGYDISEVDKSMEECTKSSTSDVNTDEAAEVETPTITKGNDKNMSDEIMAAQEARIVALEKQLKTANAAATLSAYSFEKELETELSVVLASVEEGQDVLLKAFDALIAQGEVALAEAGEVAAAELEKAQKSVSPENPLVKELSEEAGESVEAEVEIEKSLSDRIAAFAPQSK